MGEDTWLCCDDPWEMVRFLIGQAADPRKLRLLLCGCCRRETSVLADPLLWCVLGVTEAFADGQADDKALRGAYEQASELYWLRMVLADAPSVLRTWAG